MRRKEALLALADIGPCQHEPQKRHRLSSAMQSERPLHPSIGDSDARYDYAGVMWRLIAYSSSSAFVLTFNVSIIRYL